MPGLLLETAALRAFGGFLRIDNHLGVSGPQEQRA
jgi:hypothetical protein